MMKYPVISFAILAVALLGSCSSEKKDEKRATETYKVISPIVKDTVYTNEYIAEINAFQNIEIHTRVDGFLEDIHVDEGQYVKKGQLLFTISSQSYVQEVQKATASMQSAVAELKSAEIELANTEKLLAKNIIADTELEVVKAEVEALKAKVAEAQTDENQAKLNLSFAQLKAPYDGFINRIPYKTGSLVDEGTLLTTISNNHEVFAYFNVSEGDYLDYVVSSEEGKPKEVLLMLANNTLYPHKGFIETTASEFDRNTGTIAFRAKFPNPDNLLKHGASGKVLVNTPLKDALLIPQKSTFDQQENLCVFVVDNEGKVRIQTIVPSVRLPKLFVVSSGISSEDKIIYEGVQLVKEGDVIIPEMVSFSEAINQ